MKNLTSLLLLLLSLSLSLSFICVNSFVNPSIMLRKTQHINSMTSSKHNFQDISRSLTIADKYFLIHSLINHIVLRKPDLLLDYCYKNFNYTNITNIMLSSDLEFMIKKHCHNKTTLELYDTISENAKLTDCYMNIHTL